MLYAILQRCEKYKTELLLLQLVAYFRFETSCEEGRYTRNFVRNLSRSGVALQVAEEHCLVEWRP